MSDLEFGLTITVLGMGTVFAMLILLWGILELVLRLDRPVELAAPASVGPPVADAVGVAAAPASAGQRVRIVGEEALDPALVAAIGLAVLHHAEARRQQAAPAMRTYWPGSLLFASRWVSAGRTRQGQSWRRRR